MSLPPSPARPARLAGFILIGVAVVAVGLGVFELTSGGGTSSQAGSPVTPAQTTTTQARPTTTSAKPTTTTTTPAAPTTTYPSGQTTTVAQPPPATTPGNGGASGGGNGSGQGGGQGSGTGGSGGTSSVMVRVYNNGTIPKLAASASNDFRNAGYNVVETGNYSQEQGVINTTTVYYSPLPGEQATAEAMGKQFSMRVQPRFPGIASASPGVIVILTNDFKGQH